MMYGYITGPVISRYTYLSFCSFLLFSLSVPPSLFCFVLFHSSRSFILFILSIHISILFLPSSFHVISFPPRILFWVIYILFLSSCSEISIYIPFMFIIWVIPRVMYGVTLLYYLVACLPLPCGARRSQTNLVGMKFVPQRKELRWQREVWQAGKRKGSK